MAKSEDLLNLRCSNCGAPLEAPATESEFVKCGYCGTTQKMVDAKAFLDQIMGQVYGWVRAAIPSGFDLSSAQNADPIARHNLFMTYVKPNLTTEYREYRFNLFSLLANPLMLIPFKSSGAPRTSNTSQQLFEFNAKNKSILPLAVDDESKTLVAEVDRNSTTYAYLINNLKLMQENRPERYALMAANLNQSYELLKQDEKNKPLADRVLGLKWMAMGADQMLNGKLGEARESFGKAKENLDSAKNGVVGNINLGTMYQAIEKELLLLSAMNCMLQAAELDLQGNSYETMARFERIVQASNGLDAIPNPRWASAFKDERRWEEIFRTVLNIRQAQQGSPTLNVQTGSGAVLFPFWLVDFPYSFKTGSLWMKKGVEVSEVVLVSASFPSNPAILADPPQAVTDIFGNFEGSGIMDSLTGKETSMSGGSLKAVPSMVSAQNIVGRRAIPPLSTKKEAAMFVEDYIARITRADSNVGRKLRLSAPQIKGLIFVPGEMSAGGFSLNYNFGNVRPRNIGDIAKMSSIML